MSNVVFKFIKRFSRAVLDYDDSEKPDAQIEMLRDFLSRHKYIFTKNFDENLEILKRKHLIDSFIVTNLDGSIIVSSNGNGHEEGLTGTALYSYIKGEFPDSQSVLIKQKDNWFMLVSLNKRVYIIKAGSEMTNIELVALAEDIQFLLNGHKMPENGYEKQEIKRSVKN